MHNRKHFLTTIIESVDSICRDSNTQYIIIIQKNLTKVFTQNSSILQWPEHDPIVFSQDARVHPLKIYGFIVPFSHFICMRRTVCITISELARQTDEVLLNAVQTVWLLWSVDCWTLYYCWAGSKAANCGTLQLWSTHNGDQWEGKRAQNSTPEVSFCPIIICQLHSIMWNNFFLLQRLLHMCS